MESQQDIVDLTINDDDDCFFLTELSKMAANSLKMNGMGGGNKKLQSKIMKMLVSVDQKTVKVSMDQKTVK